MVVVTLVSLERMIDGENHSAIELNFFLKSSTQKLKLWQLVDILETLWLKHTADFGKPPEISLDTCSSNLLIF